MIDVVHEKGAPDSPIAIIDRFGTALVNCKDFVEILKLAGEAVHALLPEAMLYMSRVSPDGAHMQGTWQSGFDRYLDILTGFFGIDLLRKKFSLSRATAEELKYYRNGKLHHYEDGIHNLSIRSVPKAVCFALEKALNLGAVYAIGFAWNDKHYGALVLLLQKGKQFRNAEAIETVVHLGSVGIQRVLAEEAIRHSEAKYRTLVQQSHEGIGISRGNRLIFANESLAKIFGCDSAEEAIRYSQLDIIAPDSKASIRSRMRLRDLNLPVEGDYEYKIIRKDGKIRDISIKTSVIVLDGEKCIQSSLIDNTDLKIAGENRSRVQKLEALGTLSAGIAHDFNNLHMGIFGYIECAREKIREDVPVQYLEKALACIEEAKELTARLITFSPGGAPALKNAAIFPFVEEAITGAINGSGVTLTVEKQDGLTPCLYDENQLRTVLQALTLNAVEAMPEEDRTFCCQYQPRFGHPWGPPGGKVSAPLSGRPGQGDSRKRDAAYIRTLFQHQIHRQRPQSGYRPFGSQAARGKHRG